MEKALLNEIGKAEKFMADANEGGGWNIVLEFYKPAVELAASAWPTENRYTELVAECNAKELEMEGRKVIANVISCLQKAAPDEGDYVLAELIEVEKMLGQSSGMIDHALLTDIQEYQSRVETIEL